MIYLALIIAASLILGLFILLLVEIGRQNKPKPKKVRNYKPIKKVSKPSLIEPNSFQNRARLRAQSQRTGKKIYSPSPPPPVVVRAEPEPEPELELEPEPEPEPEKLLIPDYFVPLKKPKTERKRRKPTQFYPSLVRLLNGDEKGADRLVQNLLDAYPDKSEKWCYEKALFDLTRDRH